MLGIPPDHGIIYAIIYYGIGALILALLIRAIASWFRMDERYAFIRFLARLTDPFITPIRRVVRSVGVIDLSFLIAWFLLRFTTAYGLIREGRVADRAFLRFITIVVAQPLITAAAFAVLNNVMGVAWNAQVPELPAIQEGI